MGKLLNPRFERDLVVVMAVVLQFSLIGCDRRAMQTSDDPFSEARSRIEQLMEDEGIAAYQVAVARGEEILYSEAFGWANEEEKIATTTDTMFRVASIEKPFVSTALMTLVERGQIALDDPVNDYLGDDGLVAYRGDAADATIARLLFHTTGLPYGYYHAGDEVPEAERRTPGDLIALSGVLVAEPGTRYQYTNIGYELVGEIIEDVSGESVKGYITREVLESLGLHRTRFFDSEPPLDGIATQNSPEGVLPVAFESDGRTALFSTAEDLARFGMFHLHAVATQEPILSNASLDLLWEYEDPNVESTRRMGWDVQQDFGFTTVQHGGGGPGMHNWLYMIPSEGVVISILSNARYSSPKTDPALKALIGAALSESGKGKFNPDAGRGWPPSDKLDPSVVSGSWTGSIQGPKGRCRVDFIIDDNGNPKMLIEGDDCSEGAWVSSSGPFRSGNGLVLWRFDACVPFLSSHAPHDEVIIIVWPEGDQLIGSASAANEKNFGKGESYVLPQYLELTRTSSER